jgi:hypothetical protein
MYFINSNINVAFIIMDKQKWRGSSSNIAMHEWDNKEGKANYDRELLINRTINGSYFQQI